MIDLPSAAPYIAAFVILRQDDKVAFVLRSNTTYMNGHYGLPSGKVEWSEPFSMAAIREAKEEVGITVKPEHLHQALTVHRHSEDSDWIDVYFEVDEWTGEVVNAEPDIHSEVAWLDPSNLPENTVPHVRFAFEQLATGKVYAEDGWLNS